MVVSHICLSESAGGRKGEYSRVNRLHEDDQFQIQGLWKRLAITQKCGGHVCWPDDFRWIDCEGLF